MSVMLTTDQMADFRVDLDLPSQGVFGDDELNRFYIRASGDFDKAKVFAVRAILMSAAKLHNYSAGQSSESLGQVFDHLKGMLEILEAQAGMSGAAITLGKMGMNTDATSDNQDEWDVDSAWIPG